MHPNRATSTLFSNFLLFPTDLTQLLKTEGHQRMTAVVHGKQSVSGEVDERRSIDIPVGRLSDKIALPPKAFFELGYQVGDRLQFHFNGKQVDIEHLNSSLMERINECETDDTGIKIPPAWLIQAFTGVPDTIDHIESGKSSAEFYVDLYKQFCGDYAGVERVMDFGCGCGRVLSRMPGSESTRYFGVDLHEEALQWLRETMPKGAFSVGSAMPPVDLEKQNFDLIYSVSVLTHLPQEQEHAWLDEWHRLLKDDGLVIATFRGEDCVDQMPNERQRMAIRNGWSENNGFFYQKHHYWKGIFPEFYAGTYQTIDYVRSNWGKRFEILTIVPAADSPNQQNTAVMRKKSD
jgi:SAM-dependent methyltransferase